MARRPEKQEQAAEVSSDFPYREYMNHPAWSVLENALNELQSNDDLELRTAQRYVVGLILKELAESKLVPPSLQFPNNGSASGQWVYQVVVPTQTTQRDKQKSKNDPKRLTA